MVTILAVAVSFFFLKKKKNHSITIAGLNGSAVAALA
jgi:hypothetical protein